MAPIVRGFVVVKSGVNKRCASDASRIKVKNRVNVMKITNGVETCARQKKPDQSR